MIFILGGQGFVGSAFARYCEQHRVPHTTITRSNYEALVGEKCRVFVNANGNSSKIQSRRDPAADFDASVRSVRRSLIDFPADLYVHLSSCDVYPACSSPGSSSEASSFSVADQSRYGFHKYLAEQCVMHSAPKWLIFRMGGFVGPGLKKNAIYDILHGGPLWLDPTSRLQFIQTDICAEIILRIAEKAHLHNEVFNICGRGTIGLDEVMEFAGVSVPVQPNSPIVHYEADIRKLSQLVDIPRTYETVRTYVEEFGRDGGMHGNYE